GQQRLAGADPYSAAGRVVDLPRGSGGQDRTGDGASLAGGHPGPAFRRAGGVCQCGRLSCRTGGGLYQRHQPAGGRWRDRQSVTALPSAQLCSFSQAVRVFSSRQARVIGPTPPGTGVIQAARSAAASKSTSPRSRPSSMRLIPTSMTMAPGLIHSPLTSPGLPTATTTRSERRTCSSRSWVKRCATVVVQPASSSSRAIGRPTILDAPTTVALSP